MTIKEFINWMATSTRGEQIKNSLDKTTIEKIVKGAVWSGINAGIFAGIIAFLYYILGVDTGNISLNTFLAAVIPTLINAIKEYQKGVAK